MNPIKSAKPMVTVTIEPMARRAPPREHAIRVTVMLSTIEARFADRASVLKLTRESLGGFAPENGETDRRKFSELSVESRPKSGAPHSVNVGIEGSVVWRARPSDESVEQVRGVLTGGGYRVHVRERRECAESGCASDAAVDWGQSATPPAGWFSDRICGKHGYRSCARCATIYLLSSDNCDGQGPSLHCEVCGQVLVEWGGSKIWSAELVTRGAAPSI